MSYFCSYVIVIDMTKYPFTEGEFRSIYSKATRLTVGVVIQTEQGVVLTLRSLDTWKGQWHIPG